MCFGLDVFHVKLLLLSYDLVGASLHSSCMIWTDLGSHFWSVIFYKPAPIRAARFDFSHDFTDSCTDMVEGEETWLLNRRSFPN